MLYLKVKVLKQGDRSICNAKYHSSQNLMLLTCLLRWLYFHARTIFFFSQKFLRNPDFSTKFSDYIITCETFITKCIKTCWMMNMQEVPMCLKFAYQPGDPFKRELYKEYTKCGGQCGYLVWPLLLLHVDGPVLQKGVMQPL